MRSTPRFLSRRLTRKERTVYGSVTLFFLLLFVASIWPVYPLFGGIRPMLLGIPFSLLYVVLLLTAGFLVLLALFLWDGRRGVDREERPAAAPRAGPPMARPSAADEPPRQPLSPNAR